MDKTRYSDIIAGSAANCQNNSKIREESSSKYLCQLPLILKSLNFNDISLKSETMRADSKMAMAMSTYWFEIAEVIMLLFIIARYGKPLTKIPAAGTGKP